MEGEDELPDETNRISLDGMVPEHNDWSFSFGDGEVILIEITFDE